MTHAIHDRLAALPDGYFQADFAGRHYGVVKRVFNAGRSVKLVGRELGGTDYISLNLYALADGRHLLKPCEMPAGKVVDFVAGLKVRDT
ncbi:MAG: hypothetical protein AAF415_16650 [Pseudomonadota bacterium]